jgi:hypothetical protein
MRSYNIFGAWMNHGQMRTHKTHHSLGLGEATTFPLIVFFMFSHEASTQMSFCPRKPEIPKLQFPQLWRPIILCANLRLR